VAGVCALSSFDTCLLSDTKGHVSCLYLSPQDSHVEQLEDDNRGSQLEYGCYTGASW